MRERIGRRASTGMGDGLTRTAEWLRERPWPWERYGVAESALCEDLRL